MQKSVKRIFTLFLSLLFALTGAMTAFAEVSESDFTVSVDTNKDTYADGDEIGLQIGIDSQSNAAVTKVELTYDIPEELKDKIPGYDKLPTVLNGLEAGANVIFTNLEQLSQPENPDDNKPGDGNDPVVKPGDSDGTGNPAQTSDAPTMLIWIAVFAAAGTLVVVGYKKKWLRKSLSALLTAAMVLSMVGIVSPSETYAASPIQERGRVSVHDPSIVKEGDTYYVFGSHLAWAKSTDLKNWTTFTNNINTNFRTLFAAEAAWARKADSSYDVDGNMWAPDVIYNEAMGKWCMYMSINGPKWNSTICLLTADHLDGNWTYVGPVIQSGMSMGFGPTFDYTKVTGETTVNSRYTNAVRKGNPTIEPHAIDPCVTYDEDGNLWMSYGSWSGGIGLIRLDNKTGLRDYNTKYASKSSVSDPYTGYKIAGGNQSSGEASYIEHIGDYYYLFVTYGGLAANGGYNMRVFRSKEITGPYVDESGEDARYPMAAGDPGSSNAGNTNGHVGNRLMSYYKWSFMDYGYVAEGHNSAFVDSDGKAYVVYHTRFNNGTEWHQVRVHQLFLNEDGWLVAAPFEYTGESLPEKITTAQIAGVYETLFQTGTDFANVECVEGVELTFAADGTVTGARTGTWKQLSDGSPYVTLKLGNTTYKGVFLEQKKEGTDETATVFTVLGSDEVSVWGYRYDFADEDRVEATCEKLEVPMGAVSSFTLPTSGAYGTTIQWESSNPAVLTAEGKVTTPAEDTEVTLTATITYGEATTKVSYTVKVFAEHDGMYKVADFFTNDPQDLSYVDVEETVVTASGSKDITYAGKAYTLGVTAKITCEERTPNTYTYRNPYNRNVTAGLAIYNGVSIKFKAQRTGTALDFLSNIFRFNEKGANNGLWFTGGSYLGYNTGNFFDANVDNSDKNNWKAGTDFLGTEETAVEIKILPKGFEVYVDGKLAYDQDDIAGKVPGGKSEQDPFAEVLRFLNNTADELNFGKGAFDWDTPFNGKISDVELWVEAVEKADASGYEYYEDYNNLSDTGWTSPNAQGYLKFENDGDEHANYVEFALDTTQNSRAAYTTFSGLNLGDSYTVETDVKLTAGNNQTTEFAITAGNSTYMADNEGKRNANNGIESGYILKLSSEKSTTWSIVGTNDTVVIPKDTWVHISATVDKTTGKVTVKITNGDTTLYTGTVTVNGESNDVTGLYVRGGRYNSVTAVDNVTVKNNGSSVTPEPGTDLTATATVSGKAYPDTASEVTVTFKGNQSIDSSKYYVTVNGTKAATGITKNLATVKSVSYKGDTVEAVLSMKAMEGWHDVEGSYTVALTDGTKTYAEKTVDYELAMSANTNYTQIKTAANTYSSAYYKVDGTKMYVMSIIKTDKLHSDGSTVGGTAYAWWNGMNSQIYLHIDGKKYSVGSHAWYSSADKVVYANGILWDSVEPGAAEIKQLIDDSSVVRGYMDFGTFNNDADTDTGCILLNVVDLSVAGYNVNTLANKQISFSGYVGPNDGNGRFTEVNAQTNYTIK